MSFDCDVVSVADTVVVAVAAPVAVPSITGDALLIAIAVADRLIVAMAVTTAVVTDTDSASVAMAILTVVVADADRVMTPPLLTNEPLNKSKRDI
jgi:hypothetical protein